MAISERLKVFLQDSKIRYTVVKHPVVYTAQEIAAAQHIPGRQLAKCVLVHTNRGALLAVLPASYLIDFKKLKAVAGVSRLSLSKEADIKERFPDVEVGAMSPFGNLYQVPVIVEKVLGESEEIVFNAGTHTETIKMRYRDFALLVKPKAGSFGQPAGGPKTAHGRPSKARSGKAARPPLARKSRSSASGRTDKKSPARSRAKRRR